MQMLQNTMKVLFKHFFAYRDCFLLTNLCLLYIFHSKKGNRNAGWTHFIPILYVALLKFSEALLYTKRRYERSGQSKKKKAEVFNHILCACNQCK